MGCYEGTLTGGRNEHYLNMKLIHNGNEFIMVLLNMQLFPP